MRRRKAILPEKRQPSAAAALPPSDSAALEGVTVFLFAILANLAAQVVFSVVMAAVGVATGDPGVIENTYVQLVSMVLIQLFYLAVPLIYFGVYKKRRPVLLVSPKNRTNLAGLALTVTVPVVCMLCFYLPAAWFDALLRLMNFQGGGGVTLEGAGQIVFGVAVMVVLAPVVEETIFRGFLLSGLRRKLGDAAAVLLTGLAFALMHMNPEQTVYQFLLGCACGVVALASRSLILPIVVHAASNLLALLFDLTPLGGAFSALMGALTSSAWAGALSTVLLFASGAAAVFFLGRAIRATAPKIGEPLAGAEGRGSLGKVALTVYWAAVGLCLIMWIFVFASGLIAGQKIGG